MRPMYILQSGKRETEDDETVKTEAQISLSVVVPVYNEGQNIEHLFQEIKMVCESGIDGIPFD